MEELSIMPKERVKMFVFYAKEGINRYPHVIEKHIFEHERAINSWLESNPAIKINSISTLKLLEGFDVTYIVSYSLDDSL